MELPEDLGRRIVEAASLAVTLHLQHSLVTELYPGGTGIRDGGAIVQIGSADLYGTNATDGDFRADPRDFAGADCEAA
jgi:hypothetical protein